MTKILQEAVGEARAADQNNLLNFVDAKSSEFEAAQDATAIETILNAAVSANSITQEGKSILFTAVQKSLAMDAPSNQMQTDAEDPAETRTSTNEQPEVTEMTGGNKNQPATSPSGENQPDSITSTVDKSEAAEIPNDNMKKAVSHGWTSGTGTGAGTAIINAGSYTAITTGGLLWLLALYLGATWLAVGSLSSIQFRDDIEHKYNTTLNETLKLKDLQADVEQYRSSMMASVSTWEFELWKLAINFGVQFDTISSPEGFQKVCVGERRPDNIKSCDRLLEVLSKFLAYQENKSNKEKVLKQAIDSYMTIHAAGNNKAEVGTPDSGNKPNDLEARIGFMLKFHFGDMLKMPEQVLTLLLAIAMGVLGSTITMTWTFLGEKTSLPLRWYLLRPFVGALSALVIFIFAKAGQMSLITNAANATLSPFMLSLLGIAAGLLSDRAYAQMSSVSGKFLGNMGTVQERWSSHLEEELKKQNMTSEALATALNLDKHRIDEIITGARMASLQEQQRISDRLGIAQRLLFTDIPP